MGWVFEIVVTVMNDSDWCVKKGFENIEERRIEKEIQTTGTHNIRTKEKNEGSCKNQPGLYVAFPVWVKLRNSTKYPLPLNDESLAG